MKITVYSTTTCPYCTMLEQWLEQKSIKYTRYNVDENPYALQTMVAQSGQRGVPFSTIEFDDGRVEKVLGFDRPRFESILKLS
jgi:glutaredoxin